MLTELKLYLFQYGTIESYALSIDKTGCNLPKNGHPWLLRAELFAGDVDADVRAALSGHGFCMVDHV